MQKYEPKYDAYIRIGAENVNIAHLPQEDFQALMADLMVKSGILVGVKRNEI